MKRQLNCVLFNFTRKKKVLYSQTECLNVNNSMTTLLAEFIFLYSLPLFFKYSMMNTHLFCNKNFPDLILTCLLTKKEDILVVAYQAMWQVGAGGLLWPLLWLCLATRTLSRHLIPHFLVYVFILYWNIVDIQCSVRFRCTAK